LFQAYSDVPCGFEHQYLICGFVQALWALITVFLIPSRDSQPDSFADQRFVLSIATTYMNIKTRIAFLLFGVTRQ
jgi:hypothetical protein